MNRYIIFSTPLGWCGAVKSNIGIKKFFLPTTDRKGLEKTIQAKYPDAKLIKHGWSRLIKEVRAYFKGKRVSFNFPLDLSSGTPFQRKVWNVTRKIGWGRVLSYSEVASRLKNPKSSRAVGAALGKNPLPLLIPCHRVIQKSGFLGGFSGPGGVKLKRKMLELEQTVTT